MKRILIGLVFGVMAFGQQQAKPAAKAAAKPVAKKAQAPQKVTVPKDAKEIHPGTFRWVDPKGVAWLYTVTPFGIMKGEEPKDQQPEAIPTDWTVKENGDNLEFERPWPFGGLKRWTKAKNDLTEVEKAVWQRQQAQASR